MTSITPSAASGVFPSRFAFLMGAIASAVGLGNFWRFPYIAGEHGGAAFIYVYLGVTTLIALPLLMAEYAMGRKSGMPAIDGVYSLARAESQRGGWGLVAWTGTLTAFFILTFYIVVATWLAASFLALARGTFTDESLAAIRSGNAASKLVTLSLLALFLAALVFVVGRGLKTYLERVAVFAMPAFFAMLLILMVTALQSDQGASALAFLTEPDWSQVNFRTVLAAMSQSFFSIGLGISLMMTYGASLGRSANIPAASVSVVAIDTAVSLIAALALFPFLFARGHGADAGPDLFFLALPLAFEAVPGGALFGFVFLALALFAAFTSSVALIETSVSWLEERPGVTRRGAALGMGVILFMFGAAYVWSPSYFRFVDFIMEGILLPLGALLVAVFAGWTLSREMLASELGEGALMNVWRFLMRWILPLVITVLLFFGLTGKIMHALAN